MTTVTSIISFVVLLLASSSFSAPLVLELQNATSVPQVENATGAFHFDNLIVLARREAEEERSVKDTVGLSSSSSEEDASKTRQTTEKLALREAEDDNQAERELDNDVNSLSEDEDSNNAERSVTQDSFTTQVNSKRAAEEEDAQSFDDDENSNAERSVTEDSFTTQVNGKRAAEDEDAQSFDDDENSNAERSVTEETFTSEMKTKHGIEVETFESSTVDQTSVAPSTEVKTVKRSSGNNGWLAAESDDDEERTKRSSGNNGWLAAESDNDEERAKRSSGSNGWLAAESDNDEERTKRSSGSNGWLAAESDNDEERTKRSSGSNGWLAADSDDDEERTKRSSGGNGWLAADSDDEVQKRSVKNTKFPVVNTETSTVEDSSIPSSSEMTHTRRAMGQPSSLSEEASEEFNRRAVGPIELEESSTIIAAKIQSEFTTNEQPSFTTTEVIREQVSSTLESETSVTPVDDFTSSSPVSTTSKSKILAIIPGQISKSQLVINPANGQTAGFRPVHQIQLSQGQNQTVVEEKKPNH